MIKKNLFYNIIYQLLIVLLPMIVSPYISRVLGATQIGQYSYSNTIVNYFVLFAMLGINNYGNRQIAMSKYDQYELRTSFWNIYFVQLFMSAVCVLGYIVYLMSSLCINLGLALAQSLTLLSAVLDVNWLFFGLEKFKLTVSRNMVIKITSTVLIFLFVKNQDDVIIYAVIQCGALLLSNLYIWIIALKEVPFIKPNLQDMIFHLKPIMIYFIPVIAVSLYKYMDKIMIQLLSNSDELGYYDNCEKLIVIVSGLVNALGTVMLPRTSTLVGEGKYKEAEGLLSISIRSVTIGSIAITSGIIAIADTFAPVFWGKDFSECGVLLIVLALTIFPNSIGCVIRTQYLIPYKKDKVYIISVFSGAIVNIIFNSILIPKYGAVGAAVGTICAEMVVMIYQKIMAEKSVKISFKGIIPTTCVCIIMIIAVRIVMSYINNSYFALVAGIITGIVCFGLLHGIYSWKVEKDLLTMIKNEKF